MKLSDLDFLKLIPIFMRDDETVGAMADVVNEYTHRVDKELPLIRKWDQIDSMDDPQLDELAYELNVLWYDTGAPIETKRRLIKKSDMVYARLGTKWAVEEVVTAYLGDALVSEWWEYSGQPHHFKIISNNPLIGAELEDLFTRALEPVKRKSQWLDAIVVSLEAAGAFYVGLATQDVTVETTTITDEVGDMSPTSELTAYSGGAYFESRAETVTIT